MSRKLIAALLLIALCALFFVFTDGSTTIEVFSFQKKLPANFALFSFTGLGVVIGLLLK